MTDRDRGGDEAPAGGSGDDSVHAGGSGDGGDEDDGPTPADDDGPPSAPDGGVTPGAVPDVTEPPAAGDDEEVEPVEVLVGLAEEGEIEPWDIDIVAVTDKFLARLDEADLRTSGRALFYASVLLRMKSDALLEDDEEEAETEDEPDPWAAFGGPAGGEAVPGGAPGDAPDGTPGGGHDPVSALESEMERRLDRKDARGTPETLDGLVRELRSAERESWWKESRSYDTTESPTGFRRGTQTVDYQPDDTTRAPGEPTAEEVTGATHGEDMDAITDDVGAALREQYERGRESVLFAEVAEAGGSRVLSYLGLLFLAHGGDVWLEQDELFGDLWIHDAD